jgi:hypothetical protein
LQQKKKEPLCNKKRKSRFATKKERAALQQVKQKKKKEEVDMQPRLVFAVREKTAQTHVPGPMIQYGRKSPCYLPFLSGKPSIFSKRAQLISAAKAHVTYLS